MEVSVIRESRQYLLSVKKTLLPGILIFQKFLKFSIAKRECLILACCP